MSALCDFFRACGFVEGVGGVRFRRGRGGARFRRVRKMGRRMIGSCAFSGEDGFAGSERGESVVSSRAWDDGAVSGHRGAKTWDVKAF